ncbi:GntR family transcriptional regulator [Mycobacterium sp. 134]|uniref:GntR family transcriptional regulator n=1 Tax=Mycobacterium sp. 134 TaxID=3400425 RepID=UPI003AAEF040
MSKSERAYQAIRTEIATGKWSAGHRLVLTRIAESLGISVVPVREALRRLEAEGLVTFERNLGATVSFLDVDEYTWAMQTLAVVEAAATGYSAPLLSKRACDSARAINARMRETLLNFDPSDFTELNEQFHRTLCSACPNTHLNDLVDVGWARMAVLRTSTFGFVPGRAEASVNEHEHLLDLIEAGASRTDIERAAREHRESTLNAVLSNPPKGGLFPSLTAGEGIS